MLLIMRWYIIVNMKGMLFPMGFAGATWRFFKLLGGVVVWWRGFVPGRVGYGVVQFSLQS